MQALNTRMIRRLISNCVKLHNNIQTTVALSEGILGSLDSQSVLVGWDQGEVKEAVDTERSHTLRTREDARQ